MNLLLELQYAVAADEAPSKAEFTTWVQAALQTRCEQAEVVIRVVDEAEIAELNLAYRHKTGATNVLAFPFQAPAPVTTALLGDLVICAPVVKREALTQSKPEQAHWAHMSVHGSLHLLGYDHQTRAQAEAMEALETKILAELGFPPPY